MKTIYLCEDETTIREGVCQYLKLEGYEVKGFANILETQHAISSCEPDLLIQDVMLPDGDGFSFIKKLKSNHSFPVVFLTARTRLRPILMTTLTTVLKMVPMAFFPKEGASSMQPIALTFVGGLLTGSFMTLFLSPILYTVFNRNKERRFNDPNAIDNQIAAFDAKYGTVR